MKRSVSIYLIVVVLMVSLMSCLKQDQVPLQPSRPNPVQHPIAGQEIQLDSLAWQPEDFFNNVYILIDNRPDIFLYPRPTEVSLRLDTSLTWIVPNSASGLVYTIGMGRFFMAPGPPNTSLEGKYASIRIKFL